MWRTLPPLQLFQDLMFLWEQLCWFTAGTNTYFWVCIFTSLILWIWKCSDWISSAGLHVAPLKQQRYQKHHIVVKLRETETFDFCYFNSHLTLCHQQETDRTLTWSGVFPLCVYMWRTLPLFSSKHRSVCFFTDGTVYIFNSLMLSVLKLWVCISLCPCKRLSVVCSLAEFWSFVSGNTCTSHLQLQFSSHLDEWSVGVGEEKTSTRSPGGPDQTWQVNRKLRGCWSLTADRQENWWADVEQVRAAAEQVRGFYWLTGWQVGVSESDMTPAPGLRRIRSDQMISDWVGTSSCETNNTVDELTFIILMKLQSETFLLLNRFRFCLSPFRVWFCFALQSGLTLILCSDLTFFMTLGAFFKNTHTHHP